MSIASSRAISIRISKTQSRLVAIKTSISSIEGTQASYENRGESNQSPNGDIESRVSRLEKEIEHLGAAA